MSEVEDLLNLIKECWPKFAITKENLLRPTQDVVVRFYNNFIDDCNEKPAYLTGGPTISEFNMGEYEPEEQLFLQLSGLLGKIGGLKFTLADIYQPTAIRTKNFFRVCIHFAAFTDHLQNEAEELGNKVFKTKEDMTKLSMEEQVLIDEINEMAKTKAELTESNTLLEQEYKSEKSAYKEMNVLKAATDELFAEKRSQIENLKREFENGELESKRLKNMEKELSEQRITEREHKGILNNLESLKKESEILDNNDIDIDDGLAHQIKVLQHTADCIQVLNKINADVVQIEQLIQTEEQLNILSKTVDKLVSTKINILEPQKVENEHKLLTSKQELSEVQSEHNKIVNDVYTNSLHQFSQELITLKNSLDEKSNSNCEVILKYKKDIEKLEQDLEKLKKAFTTEYVRGSKKEKMVVDKFKEMLMKFKEMDLL